MIHPGSVSLPHVSVISCNSDSNLLSSEGVDAFGWAVLPGSSGTPVGGWRTGVQGFPYNQVCENSVAPVELSWVSSFSDHGPRLLLCECPRSDKAIRRPG